MRLDETNLKLFFTTHYFYDKCFKKYLLYFICVKTKKSPFLFFKPSFVSWENYDQLLIFY